MSPKIYTKTGDKGQTGLVSGHRVSKSDLRLNCYGTVDELNSAIGIVRASLNKYPDIQKEIDPIMDRLQNELFDLGSRLACDSEQILEKLPSIRPESLTFMETTIDRFTKEIPELKNFILPGGVQPAAIVQWARCVCRRAERLTVELSEKTDIEPILVQYLNRLSDFLFVIGRYSNHIAGHKETIWKKHP